MNTECSRRWRGLIRAEIVIALLSGFGASGQEVVRLPSAPKPEQIAAAKTAFEGGSVVAMQNADAARFSGILNVGLLSRQPEDGANVARHCIAAAKKTSRGRVHLFAGDLVKPGRNDNATCERDFERWLSSQELLQDTQDPNGWTEINNYAVKNTSLSGDEYARTTTIYRANTTDQNNDYFLIVQENSATAATGSMVFSNSTQLYGTYSAGGADPFDWGPQGVSGSNTFTIGSSVPVQTGSAAFTVSWDGVTGLVTNGSKANSLAFNFQQQTTSGSTTLNVPSLLYDGGLIIAVPKRTTSVLGVSTLTSFFQDGSGASTQYPAAGLFDVRGIAPVLSACATGVTGCQMDLFVTPGSTGNSFQITASSYLNWTLTAPDWIETDGPVTEGQGSQTITFSVDSAATVGTIGLISLDTSPSYAAPSVGSGPLQIRVHVALAPPATGVLFAGGQDWSGNPLASAEIWDPATSTVVPTNGAMATARSSHTATALANGKILIAGGFGSDGNALNTTELFDPASDTFGPGPDMVSAHALHTATLLQDGTVLVTSGTAGTANDDPVDEAEIYDPDSNNFTQVGNPDLARKGHVAVLTNEGSVVLMGWMLAPVNIDIYDPITQKFSPGVNPEVADSGLVAVHLANDQILRMGGGLAVQGNIALLYTPAARTFSVASRSTGNVGINAAGSLLPDQTAVIFAGGSYQGAEIPAGLTVQYSPASETFTTLPSSTEKRVQPTAAFVPGISAVVVAGGVPAGSGSTNGTAVELFDVTQKTWSAAGTMSTARTGMTSTYFTNTSGTTSTNQQRER